MYIAFGCQAMLGVVETAEIAGQFQHTSRPFRVIQRHVWLPFEPRTIMFGQSTHEFQKWGPSAVQPKVLRTKNDANKN